MLTSLVCVDKGDKVTFTYGENLELRFGEVETVKPGLLTIKDHARNGQFRSFKQLLIKNLTLEVAKSR